MRIGTAIYGARDYSKNKKKTASGLSIASPSQALLRQLPRGGAFGSPRKLHLFANASPLGEVARQSRDGEGEPAEKYLQYPES